MSQIPTAPPSGFRDYSPDECAARAELQGRIADAYRRFGFQQIATSAVEELPVLLGKGGGENEKLIFKILKRGEKLEEAKAGGELADMGLRFDLTLPLARYYARFGSALPHPFKAFHIGPVWRAERAQKGRYREFYQCDADVVGSDSATAEIDVIAAILAAFAASGLAAAPTVLVNDRALLLERLRAAGVPDERIGAACVAIDKLDKAPAEKVASELAAAGIGRAADVLEAAVVPDARLLEIIGSVNALAGREAAVFAPNLVRGFDYYTSTVFEFRLPGASGSVGGGGRYDSLTGTFGGPKVPAVGGSIGFERLMLLLDEQRRGAAPGPGPDFAVAVFSDELRPAALSAAARLRAAGRSVDVYPGSGKLKGQFKYADQKRAARMLVIGPDEAAAGKVKVKDLKTGGETLTTVDELLK